MTRLEQEIWDLVHTWCNTQAGEIPDMNRRHLMDLILKLVEQEKLNTRKLRIKK